MSHTKPSIPKPSIALSNESGCIANERSKAATAFLTLPLVIQAALQHAKRVVLIANNPSVTQVQLEKQLHPDDIVVLFNHFIHAEFFANHPLASSLPKLLFFRQIGDSNLHFGLPPRSNHISMMRQMAETAPLGILLSNQSYQFPSPADDPRPDDDPITTDRVLTIPSRLQELLLDPSHHSVLSDQHSVVADYPTFEDIHSSAPSSGFLLYRLFLAAREYVQHTQQVAQPIELVMVGFNDNDKTAHFWHGHNWAFERQEMLAAPRGVEIYRY